MITASFSLLITGPCLFLVSFHSVLLGFMLLGVCPFPLVIQFVGIQLFIVVSYNSFHFRDGGCNVPSFVSDFNYLNLLFLSLHKGFSVLLILKKKISELLLRFPIFSCFVHHTLIFISAVLLTVASFVLSSGSPRGNAGWPSGLFRLFCGHCRFPLGAAVALSWEGCRVQLLFPVVSRYFLNILASP